MLICMNKKPQFSRRRFLKYAAMATAGITTPRVVPSTVLARPGQPGPNDR
ncbi:MAG: twin-arginine translocation signal domain-containing protein, partial [Planctomycetota bacterium]